MMRPSALPKVRDQGMAEIDKAVTRVLEGRGGFWDRFRNEFGIGG